MTIIIGIDPGSIHTGYGIVRKVNNQLEYITSGVISVKGSEVNSRLPIIFTQLKQIIREYEPTQMVIEQVFLSENPQSALKLGMARGVAILAGSLEGCTIFELSARQAKKFVTGMGAAKKDQVNRMVVKMLKLDHIPKIDASDALALAISHAKTLDARMNILRNTQKIFDKATKKSLLANSQNLEALNKVKEHKGAVENQPLPSSLPTIEEAIKGDLAKAQELPIIEYQESSQLDVNNELINNSLSIEDFRVSNQESFTPWQDLSIQSSTEEIKDFRVDSTLVLDSHKGEDRAEEITSLASSTTLFDTGSSSLIGSLKSEISLELLFKELEQNKEIANKPVARRGRKPNQQLEGKGLSKTEEAALLQSQLSNFNIQGKRYGIKTGKGQNRKLLEGKIAKLKK